MRSVGLTVLKNKLNEYVRLAAAGETILISDRDRVVAELVPPHPSRATLVPDALLADAVRQGLLTPALRVRGPTPETLPVAPLRDIVRQLEGDRAER
ncbi:MAG TPA: hypothetical protein VFN99_10080 [Gaiella sp.]|jgi:antitoxin (DNA-binding transcriptional repressor) of toxin-antitoxin stability system|nr:hypothetical protein [Gaiella sp.]